MKKKLFKFLIAASIVMMFASFTSLAAKIEIENDSEVINIETGDVSINFTSDVANTDQITVLVYTPTAQNPDPVDANIVYIDQNTNGTYSGVLSFKMKASVNPGTECTLLMGGTGVAEAASYTFTYEELKSTVSVSKTGEGIVELSTDTETGSPLTVDKNANVYLNITPAIGYYVSSVKENGTEKVGSIDAYGNSTYTYIASKDATFEVIFSEIVFGNMSDTDKTTTGITGTDALTLPEVFRGKATNDATEDVAIAFGEINASKEVAGYGIYLTYENGNLVTTANPNIGPKFAHKEDLSTDNQFGIIFEQLNPGSYFAQAYVEYTDGTMIKGIKVPFTVAGAE